MIELLNLFLSADVVGSQPNEVPFVKLDILMAFVVVFTYSLPSLGGAGPAKGPDILNLVSVGGGDDIRKLYLRILTADGVVRMVLVKGVERS
jgi:hypothetical protein